MNSIKSSLYYLLSAFLFGGVSVLTSCDNGKDVYNPDHIQEEAKKAFPVKDIDPNQTWETSAVCNASVSVNEKTGGTYTIKVYTENPYNTNGNAFLLAKTSVTNGQTVNFKFDIPSALQYVHVMKVNEKGYSSAIPVAVENGVIKVSFGDNGTTRAINNRMITTRASTINKPATLPTEVPAGSILLSSLSNQWNDVKKGGNYIVNSNTTEVNIGQPVNLYIQGNVTLTKLYMQVPWGSPANSAKIYILPESSLTLVANQSKIIKNIFGVNEEISFFSIESGYQIGVAKDAKLICNKAIIFNQEVSLYNCGTISSTHMEFNNNSQFVNDGKVILTNLLSCENPTTQVENNGEITAGSFHLAGTSSFFNESTGKVKITGESAIDSNSSTWDNQGLFESKTMTFKANSQNWFNRCKLYVNETLTITTSGGSLFMDAGSYAECKNLHMDMSRIEMGSKAYFNVLNTAILAWNIDKNGFYATGDEYALLRMNKTERYKNPVDDGIRSRTIYSGNLYIASDNHFDIGDKDTWFYELKGNAALTGIDNANIKIPTTTCSPGYNSTPDTGGDDKVQTFAYAFEDMMIVAGDYDFNDIVLYITNPIDGKVKVSLMAAGATKELKVAFKYNGKIETIFSDVYAALGVPNGTITNTGGATGKVATKEIEVGNNFSLSNDGDFFISDGTRDIHIAKFTEGFIPGDAPYAIRIASSTWKWPKESTKITDAYPAFEEWAKDATKEIDWYKDEQSISDKVIGIK